MDAQDCIDAIRKATGDSITDDELIPLTQEVQRIVREARARDVGNAEVEIIKAVGEFASDVRMATLIEKRNAALNKTAQLRVHAYISTTWGDDPAKGLTAVLGGLTSARRGSKASIGAAQTSLTSHYTGTLISAMEKKGVLDQFTTGKLDRDIWRAVHELGKESPDMGGLNPDAIKIAGVLNDVNNMARIDANRAGAWIKKLNGYVMKQSHSSYRINKAGAAKWKADVSDWLDWEKSFPGREDKSAILDQLYSDFVSEVHVKAPTKPASGFKGFANVGKQMSFERVMHFKDADAEFKYNADYGVGTLAEGTLYGLQRMAQNTALMRNLGPNAEMNLNEVISKLTLGMKKNTDPKVRKKFDDAVDRIKRTLWPNITGESNVPGSQMAAHISQSVRAVEQMSKLGSAVLSAAADIPFYGSEVRYQGGSMVGGMVEAIGSLARGKDSLQRRELIGALGVMHDGMRASVATRFDASDNMPGVTAKVTQHFFKLSGLRWWTDRLRTNFAVAQSHRLALRAGDSWAGLGEDLSRSLGLYGLDEGKWDIIRKGRQFTADERNYLTPESVGDLPDEVFAKYLSDRKMKPTVARIRDLRTEIQDQFRSYFHDRSTTAVIEPDQRTRAILLRGTRPGTVEGEMLRHVMLFKSFIASVIQKPVARELYGRGADSFSQIRMREIKGLTSLIIWNTLFGYGAMSLKDLAKGKEPRNPDDVKTWMAAAVQGGSLGIYGDFLFGDMKNRFGGNVVSTLAGPTAGSFADLTDLYQRFRDGDDTAAQTFRFATSHTPFINMFYTKWAFDYLLFHGWREAMNPGYLRRMERRVKKENDQEFLYPPSQHAKRY